MNSEMQLTAKQMYIAEAEAIKNDFPNMMFDSLIDARNGSKKNMEDRLDMIQRHLDEFKMKCRMISVF